MEQIVRLIFSTNFLFSVIRLSTPILFATMAVLISNRAGVINIAVEGTMLFAALMGVVGSAFSGNAWIGLLVAVLSGMLFSAIIAYFHLKLETDIVLTGIALSVKGVRLKALLISGAIAGFGGVFMSMSYVSMFTKDMVAGRGFIALAAEAMGQGNPVLSTLSALFFGATDALSNNLQLFNFPSELTRLMPYALTIIALAFYAARMKRQLKK